MEDNYTQLQKQLVAVENHLISAVHEFMHSQVIMSEGSEDEFYREDLTDEEMEVLYEKINEVAELVKGKLHKIGYPFEENPKK